MSFEKELQDTNDAAIAVNNLCKSYLIYNRPADRLKQFIFRSRKYYREFRVLKNISLTINKGETVGIIGRNGSGKSTLLQIICGTLQPSSGALKVNGRISALLELGTGFNPEFTGKENIYLSAAIQGLSHEETKEKYDSIVEFSGIAEHILQPVKTYSSGMYVRLAFSVAIATDPDILIVDEALSVGDEAFQRKCFSRIREIQKRGGTVVFVSHSASNVMEICSRAILLDDGELLLEGKPKEVLSRYHKLIFAPERKHAQIRQEIKTASIDHLKPIYNEDLQPETTISYEPRGAEILHPRIEALDGSPTNLLERGKEYYLRYRVNFSVNSSAVRFGMMIKTKTGIDLGGASVPLEYNKDGLVIPGFSCEVGFKFKAILAPGTYFMNTGCSGVEGGERVSLHRIIDVLMFTILPDTGSMATGMVDFSIEAEIDA